MSQLLDPRERSERGRSIQAGVIGRSEGEEITLLEQGWRDFVFAEAWNSPGLDRRSRYLVSLAGCVVAGADDMTFDGFVQGALTCGDLSIVELREAALHMGPYGGWTRARALDRAVSRAVSALDLAEQPADPIRNEPWNPAVRDAEGAAEFIKVMGSASAPPTVPYRRSIHDFIFGEMWLRCGLDERSRRWLTLVGVCDSTVDIPMRSHIHAALASGNCTIEEMHEFVLLFAVFCGWPKASIVQTLVYAMHQRAIAKLSWSD